MRQTDGEDLSHADGRGAEFRDDPRRRFREVCLAERERGGDVADVTRRDDFSVAMPYAAPPPMNPNEGELDPLGLVRLIRRRLLPIIGTTLLVVALAFPFISSLESTYYSESRLLIQSPLATTLTSSTEERIVTLDLAAEVERMLSRDVLVKAIQKLKIDQIPEFNGALREETSLDRVRGMVRGLLDGKPKALPAPVDELEYVIPAFRGALMIAREPASNIVRIGFSSRDPALAAAVPEALLGVYLDDREATLARNVARTDGWLHGRVRDQTARVNAATAAVEAFGVSSGLASDDALARATQGETMLLSVRTDIERKRFELRATLADLEASATPSDKVALIEFAPLAGLDRDLRMRRSELERLLRTFDANNASVAAAQLAVRSAENELATEIDRQIQFMRSRLAVLDQQDTVVAKQLADATRVTTRLTAAATEQERLRGVVATEQATLERILEQGRALSAESTLPVADVEVLSPAALPMGPVGKGRLFYLLVVSFAAGCLGLTVAAGLELFDRSVRSFQQLRAVAGLTPVGMVPRVSRDVAHSRAGLVGQGHEGAFGEGLRGLVLSLKQNNGGRLPASILVTSAFPGEGKSLIAAALAIELAASGQRVLLVDGDGAHGRIHQMFEGDASPGIAEYLRAEVEFDDIIRHDEASGVDYVARGVEATGRPRENDRVAALFQMARERGWLLICDSSPVFARVETTKLATFAERTLLVIRWGRTSRVAVDAAVSQLRASIGANPLGVINMVHPRRHSLYGFKESESYSGALRRYQTR